MNGPLPRTRTALGPAAPPRARPPKRPPRGSACSCSGRPSYGALL